MNDDKVYAATGQVVGELVDNVPTRTGPDPVYDAIADAAIANPDRLVRIVDPLERTEHTWRIAMDRRGCSIVKRQGQLYAKGVS